MNIKLLIIAIVCALVTGCDYTIPLVIQPETEMDTALIGLWEREHKEGPAERLLVLPLSQKEFLVSFPAGSTNAMFACACQCRANDLALVQLRWIGTAQAALSGDPRIFQFASYSIAGNTLTVRLLNADCVNRNVNSKDEFEASITRAKDNPDLFRSEMVFRRIANQK